MKDYNDLLKNLFNEILIICLLLALAVMGYLLAKDYLEMDALALKHVEAIRTHAPETSASEIEILDKYRYKPAPDINLSGMLAPHLMMPAATLRLSTISVIMTPW